MASSVGSSSNDLLQTTTNPLAPFLTYNPHYIFYSSQAATLGGMVPKTDGFNITLWILFVPIVGFSLLFAVFPFIMGNIDTSEFGPPPTV